MSMLAVDPAADAERRRGLRQMRTVAVSLLLFAAAVYVVTLDQDGFLGFVNAGAEASMVGAIADWFAVTALFKHPLGLPIPHTALIPKRKDDLGRGLEEFVGENFLQEEIIRDRIAAATISARAATWLTNEENARRVVDEVAELAVIALGKVRDEHIASLVNDALVPRFREEPISPLLGGLLDEALRDDLHHGLVDLDPGRAARLAAREPRDRAGGARRARAVVGAGSAERAGHRPDPPGDGALGGRHPRRPAPPGPAGAGLDAPPAGPTTCSTDPDVQARAERLKDRLLEHPAVISSGISLWNALRRALTASLADPQGAVRQRLMQETRAFADRLAADEALRTRLDAMAADLAVFAVDRYGAEVTAIITHTIERWDGKQAAERIELHVGRDLQFIRINGTIVGGLVGVLIHTDSLVPCVHVGFGL